MYDGIGEFLPWRMFLARSVRAGTLPLWDPYQFCGTPFAANSQSAVWYPGSLVIVLLGPVRGAGISVLLHLALAGWFMALLMRRLGSGPAGSMAAALGFAFSSWQVSWLHLPTFLQTTCWLPLTLLLVLRVYDRPDAGRAAALAGAIAMALLAGHLQLALYVLLAAGGLAIALAVRRWMSGGARAALIPAAWFAAACLLGGLLAGPQLLPAVELSRMSHRAGKPSAEGYAAYTAYAVNPGALTTLFAPDFFGNPSNPASPYFGTSRGGMLFNYAEGALYVGLLPLALAALALVRGGRARAARLGFAAMAAVALLMAFGTPVDAALYWGLPGFSQSGSPGRVLVLWALAVSALAGLGLDRLLAGEAPSWKAALGALAALAALGIALVAFWLPVPQGLAAQGMAWDPQPVRQVALAVLACGIAAGLALAPSRRRALGSLAVAVVAVDLLAAGMAYNPTAPAADAYPATKLTDTVRALVGHDRVMPVNRRWSFAGPDAVLPPNAALACELRDVQGYDSLFLRQYQGFLSRLGGGDPSPPEVGNMVFARDPASPLVAVAGVRVILSRAPLALGGALGQVDGAYVYAPPGLPGRAAAVGAGGIAGTVSWLEDAPNRVRLRVTMPSAGALTLADQWHPGWAARVDGRSTGIRRAPEVFRTVDVPAGVHEVEFEYRPASARVGIYLMLAALAACCAVIGWTVSAGRLTAAASA